MVQRFFFRKCSHKSSYFIHLHPSSINMFIVMNMSWMSLMLVFNHLPIHPTWRMTRLWPGKTIKKWESYTMVIIILSTIAKWDVNLWKLCGYMWLLQLIFCTIYYIYNTAKEHIDYQPFFCVSLKIGPIPIPIPMDPDFPPFFKYRIFHQKHLFNKYLYVEIGDSPLANMKDDPSRSQVSVHVLQSAMALSNVTTASPCPLCAAMYKGVTRWLRASGWHAHTLQMSHDVTYVYICIYIYTVYIYCIYCIYM